jgi:hypothetical protein
MPDSAQRPQAALTQAIETAIRHEQTHSPKFRRPCRVCDALDARVLEWAAACRASNREEARDE